MVLIMKIDHRMTVLMVVMAGLTIGCANVQNTTLTEMKDDGSGYTYHLESRTPMFGKSDSYNGDIDVGIDADGTWHVRTGQAATGMDNTNQVEGLQTVMLPVSALLQLIAQRAIKDATAVNMAEIDRDVTVGTQPVYEPTYGAIAAWAETLSKANKKKLIEALGGE